MKLVVYVMNQIEYLEAFLQELNVKEIKGATILNSTGMARKLIESDDMGLIGSFKNLFDNPREESRVILMAVPDEKVSVIYQIIDDTCGGLNKPNTGIVFTLSIESIKGCNL